MAGCSYTDIYGRGCNHGNDALEVCNLGMVLKLNQAQFCMASNFENCAGGISTITTEAQYQAPATPVQDLADNFRTV